MLSPRLPQTRAQLGIRVLLHMTMAIAFVVFGLYQSARSSAQKDVEQSGWPQMYCEVTITGLGYSSNWLRISYTYNFEGRDYTSTRYSRRDAQMPAQLRSALPTLAYVNPQDPSESVLSVKPLPAFGINRFELAAVLFLVMLAFESFRFIRGY